MPTPDLNSQVAALGEAFVEFSKMLGKEHSTLRTQLANALEIKATAQKTDPAMQAALSELARRLRGNYPSIFFQTSERMTFIRNHEGEALQNTFSLLNFNVKPDAQRRRRTTAVMLTLSMKWVTLRAKLPSNSDWMS